MRHTIIVPIVLLAMSWPLVAAGSEPVITALPGQAELGWVEIHGVAAGVLHRDSWEAGTLNWVPDRRHPVLSPRLSGVFRNIYAPSVVDTPEGWVVYYGAWDGVHTPNDRIYCVYTKDFLDFTYRQTVIEHGDFVHVCNVNAARLPDGSTRLVCTAYPDEHGLNKPACFSTPGERGREPHYGPPAATREDLIEIEGYPDFAKADMNGMNVILHEDGVYRLFFGDFKAMGHVYRATGKDGCHFRYEGPCLDFHGMVNDVWKFERGRDTCYLMAVHRNTDRLWYALSDDGMKFGPAKELVTSLDDADRYIVAVGWVNRGDRLLGMLYGAGAVPSLDRNRIFARWLQKRIVFTGEDGHRYETVRALGPDRQVLSLEGKTTIEGQIQIFSEDGVTPRTDPIPIKLISGAVYRLSDEIADPDPSIRRDPSIRQ